MITPTLTVEVGDEDVSWTPTSAASARLSKRFTRRGSWSAVAQSARRGSASSRFLNWLSKKPAGEPKTTDAPSSMKLESSSRSVGSHSSVRRFQFSPAKMELNTSQNTCSRRSLGLLAMSPVNRLKRNSTAPAAIQKLVCAESHASPTVRVLSNIPVTLSGIREVTVPVGRSSRIYALSDLHADDAANLRWLERNLPLKDARAFDICIIGGDVSCKLSTLSKVLHMLRKRFDEVVFTPGNHVREHAPIPPE